MTLEASGTQTAVIGTEHTLHDNTNFKTFVAYADLSNMAAGDMLELRIYSKVLSTSALNVAYYMAFSGAQSANGGLFQVSLPLPSDQEWRFTLKQLTGVGRNYDWKVISL